MVARATSTSSCWLSSTFLRSAVELGDGQPVLGSWHEAWGGSPHALLDLDGLLCRVRLTATRAEGGVRMDSYVERQAHDLEFRRDLAKSEYIGRFKPVKPRFYDVFKTFRGYVTPNNYQNLGFWLGGLGFGL